MSFANSLFNNGMQSMMQFMQQDFQNVGDQMIGFPRMNSADMPRGTLEREFVAMDVMNLERQDYSLGDRIILHSSVLREITNLNLQYPLIFFLQKKRKIVKKEMSDKERSEQREVYRKRITKIYTKHNTKNLKNVEKLLNDYKDDLHYMYRRVVEKYQVEDFEPPWPATEEEMKEYEKYIKDKYRKPVQYHYCSVKDFTSPEAEHVYMESWMMDNLDIKSGDSVVLKSMKATVQSGTFCEFVALQSGFCAIINAIGPKFLLEYAMKRYSVLFPGERILIPYEGETYELYVNKVKPENENVVSLLGTVDLEVAVLPLDPDADVTDVVKSSVNADEDKELWAMTMEQQIQMAVALEKEMKEEQVKYEKRVSKNLEQNMNYTLDDEVWNEDEDMSGWGDGIGDDTWDPPTVASEIPMQEDDAIITPQSCAMISAVATEEETRPNEKKCPHCQKWISNGAFFMHEMRCARLITKCKECGAQVSKPLMEAHMKQKHIRVECACGETVRGTDELAMHQKTDCIYKMMTCKYCQQQFKQIEFSDHTERCANETMTCLDCEEVYRRKDADTHVCTRKCHCGQRIPLKMYIFHKITDCPQRRALCTYCKLPRLTRTFDEHLEFCGSRTEQCLNCGQLVILKHMEDHVKSNCTQFSAKQTSNNGRSDLPAEYLQNLDFFQNEENYGAWGDASRSNADANSSSAPPEIGKANTMEEIMEVEDPKANEKMEEEVVAANSDNASNSVPQAAASSVCDLCGKDCGDPATVQVHKDFECFVAQQLKNSSGHNNWQPYQMPRVQPLPKHAPPAALPKWSCTFCTLENQSMIRDCAACGMPRQN